MPKRLICVFFKCSKNEFRLCRIIVDIENAQQNDVLAEVIYDFECTGYFFKNE